jgi:hypothetical protein
MMARGPMVPVAWKVGSRQVCWPTEAKKHVDYLCPACGDVVHRRGGPAVTDHFYHVKSGGCSGGEGALHAAAKHDLCDRYNAGERIAVWEPCPGCGEGAQQRWLPGDLEARVEAPTEDRATGARRRFDIGLYRNDVLVAGIEIFFAHRVDEDKAENLRQLPWCEVDARDVLQRPVVTLRVLRTDGGWRAPAQTG